MLRFRKQEQKKVFIIGLDCAAPELVFDQWKADLPNLNALQAGGLYGRLKSSIPAITVPAWTSMLTSKDPGVLGCYGFHNRAGYDYGAMTLMMNDSVREKRVWDILGQAGLQSTVLGVPQTWPVRPLRGHLVSGFLTPNLKSDFSYPFSFRNTVLAQVPDYTFDVKEFRTDNKDRLLNQVYAMTDSHFELIDYAIQETAWDFFMSVEIGVDRMHHAFWHLMDKTHVRHEPGSPYESAIYDYYLKIDRKIGAWMSMLDDNTAILVVSDHGAQRMDGGICINEWLMRKGYLTLKTDPVPGRIRTFGETDVDWSKTRAWGSGGYYGRLFLNVRGREPEGIVPAEAYEALRDTLIRELQAINGPDGRNIGTRVFKPQDVYSQVNGIAPDLIVYFGNLLWRSVGSVGYDGFHTRENDTGPDACNHSENGLFILRDPQNPGGGRSVTGAQLMDVAPTVLALMGQEIPEDMQGKVIG